VGFRWVGCGADTLWVSVAGRWRDENLRDEKDGMRGEKAMGMTSGG
jgi:hypothetical protein